MPLPGVVSVWTRAYAGGWRGRRGRAGGKQAAWEDPAQAEIDSSASAGRFRARAGARAGKGAGRNGRRRPQAPPEGAPGVENVPGHALVVAAPLAHARPGDLRRKPGRRLHGCGQRHAPPRRRPPPRSPPPPFLPRAAWGAPRTLAFPEAAPSRTTRPAARSAFSCLRWAPPGRHFRPRPSRPRPSRVPSSCVRTTRLNVAVWLRSGVPPISVAAVPPFLRACPGSLSRATRSVPFLRHHSLYAAPELGRSSYPAFAFLAMSMRDRGLARTALEKYWPAASPFLCARYGTHLF